MAHNTTPGFRDVIVVGAGPSGLLMALFLARSNIPVTVIEMSPELDKGARATHYAAPAMWELNRAGVGAEMRSRGFIPGGVCWRKLDGSMIVELDGNNVGEDPDRLTCLPLSQLQLLLRESLAQYKTAKILFDYKVTGVGQNEERAWVDVETPSGEKRLEADYIIGCDGANSQVRRSLFGDWEFPGKTWNEQIVATNVSLSPDPENHPLLTDNLTYYDFDKFKWKDANFIVDPEHWFMAARISKDGLWRITYGEKPGFTMDELRERLPGKFKAMLPGHPEPNEYKVANFAPYKVHQRLAKSMRVGRFLLAADAAHLCNPFGGLGLTGGIVDVGNLYDCLRGIYENKADESILDKYNEVRRKVYLDIIDVVSSSNLRRLFELDPDRAVEDDEFFKLAKKAETDPEFSKILQNGVRAIQHDFTQYYNTTANGSGFQVHAPAIAVAPQVE